ncbi:MAG: hypothetical protein AB7L13_18575 [Acidimicrobiia bacterium]
MMRNRMAKWACVALAGVALGACGGGSSSVESAGSSAGEPADSSVSTGAATAPTTSSVTADATAVAPATTKAVPSRQPDLLRSAAAKTEAVTSLKYDLVATISGADALPGGTFSFAATGSVDVPGQRQQFSMDLSELIKSLGGNSSTDLAGLLGDGKFEVVTVGSDAYMKSTLLDLLVGPDAAHPWLKISSTSDAMGAGAASSLTGLGDFDPTAYLSLVSAGGTVTNTPGGAIDGVETTKYSTEMDVASALKAVDAADRSKVEGSLKTFGDNGLAGAKIPLDVYVGSDGMVRRVRMNFSGVASGSTPAMNLEMTMTFHDFNQPVSITVPPASLVRDASALKLGR